MMHFNLNSIRSFTDLREFESSQRQRPGYIGQLLSDSEDGTDVPYYRGSDQSDTVEKQKDMAIQYLLDRFSVLSTSRISMRIHHVRNNIIKSVKFTKLHPSTRFCLMPTRTQKGLE